MTRDEFVHHENVAKLKGTLLATKDDVQRQTVLRLLAEEVTYGQRNGWRSDL